VSDARRLHNTGWEIFRSDDSNQEFRVKLDTVINVAGLGATFVHNLVLPTERHIQLYYAKGNYFSYNASRPKVTWLIHPAPEPGHGRLSTHLTLDLTRKDSIWPRC